MAYTEILSSHSLTAEQWDEQLLYEYIGMLWWKMSGMMGTSVDSVIQVKEDLVKQPGDAITIPKVGQLQGGKVTGNNRGIGNEGRVDFFGDRVTIDNVRQVAKITDIPMTQKRVAFDVLEAVRRRISDATAKDLDEEITTQLSDVTTGRVRGRYLYGATDGNWSATHTTALTNVDNAADQLTTNMIRVAKRKALLPVNATEIIRPMRIVNGRNFEEWYGFVGHTYSLRDLFDNDAAWKNAHLNIPPQSNQQSPIYTGSSFKGAYDGVLIFEYHRIQLISSTIQVSHNFLLGAQAAAVCWGQRPKFGEEFNDIGHEVSYENHEIRGVKKLAFDRSTVEDNGVVHVFAAAVAD